MKSCEGVLGLSRFNMRVYARAASASEAFVIWALGPIGSGTHMGLVGLWARATYGLWPMGLTANGLWTFLGPKPLELSQGGLMGSGVNGQGLGLWARATYGQEGGDESLRAGWQRIALGTCG